MAISFSGAFHHPTTPQVLTVLFVVAALVLPDLVQGRLLHGNGACPSFSCGHLRNVAYPFRRRGDPPGCGVQSYELACSDSKATIRIDDAIYYVKHINYTDQTFWVVDADLDLYNKSCPLPRWNRPPFQYANKRIEVGVEAEVELEPAADWSATFVSCSQVIKSNGMYRPVACLSTSYAFVYVLSGPGRSSYCMENLEPSCGYMAMTPLGDRGTKSLQNVSYANTIKFMRNGFAVRFPFTYGFKECLAERFDHYREKPTSSTDIKDRIGDILVIEINIWACVIQVLARRLPGFERVEEEYYITAASWIAANALWLVKCIRVLCRFVLMPLAVLIFLAHKYWRTRITIDAVEKFLRMQQMLGPTRYAYTDITAITSHFRDKLGQGGYGSVYKGVLLPGEVLVAVKMMGSSNCNGEEFISEVSTISRIHHVNVVCLVGFCSEEMRRALVYEYMPRGSLDKYIFSAEKSFSWDKLNEIALGIASGINYLHQGFGMLLLEMAGGRRNAYPNAVNSSQAYYPSWVYSQLARQEMGEIADSVVDMHELERKLCVIGLRCIQMKSHDRPTMSEVIEMLEGGVDDGLQVPPKPFFCEDEQFPAVHSYHFSSEAEPELTEISEEDE